MKRVLVLSYSDNPAEGHALSIYKALKYEGNDAYFVSLVSEFTNDTPAFFIDYHKEWGLKTLWYKLKKKYFISVSPKADNKKEYCFYNTSNYYVGNARRILNKIPIVPEVIIIGWTDFYISPKVISDLYHATHARIVIYLVDHHILGGGCHYPCDCNQFASGCKSCPALKKKSIAARLYQEKLKYLTDTPITIVGTTYDLLRARKVPFLQNKVFLSTIGTPTIPFAKSQDKARKEMGLNENDFIIMCGAYSVEDKRKGFAYLVEAVNLFCNQITKERPVTLLLLGNRISDEFQINDKIKIVKPGFLSIDQLFTAYYASDIFVSPSIDDSGPYMINYSIACGTPVVSFPIGVALDLIKHKGTGYLAKYLDVDDLAKGIGYIYNMPPEESRMCSERCLLLMDELRKNSKPWFLKVLE